MTHDERTAVLRSYGTLTVCYTENTHCFAGEVQAAGRPPFQETSHFSEEACVKKLYNRVWIGMEYNVFGRGQS